MINASNMMKRKEFHRAFNWVHIVKEKMGKVDILWKVDVLVLLFSLEMCGFGKVSGEEKEEIWHALTDIKKNNKFT